MTRLKVTLSATPNRDYPSDTHSGSVRIEPREVEVGSVAAAAQIVAEYIRDNDLGAGNLGGEAGLVRRDGAPLCRIAYNGSLWEVDAEGKDVGKRYAPPTLGSIAMLIRTAAGVTRRQMGEATGLGEALYRAWECGKNLLSVEQRQRVLRHPVMREGGLAERAMAAGIEQPRGGWSTPA